LRSQQTATLAAAAGNFIAGRLEAAVVVSAGPAVTNTMTGVKTARDNGWPLLVMGGRSSIEQDGMGVFQEFDALPLMKPVTKWAAAVRSASELTDTVRRACAIASGGRPGPVYLDLPRDVLSGSAEVTQWGDPVVEGPADPPTRELESVVGWIESAGQPLIILGDGIRWSYDRAALEKLVCGAEIPFITTSLARGALPDSHPLCQNRIRRWVQSHADLVIMVGAWFDWRFRFGAELNPGARIVHVDVDPTTLGRNVSEALTIQADPGRFLTRLAEAMAGSVPGSRRVSREAWHQRLRLAQEEHEPERVAWINPEAHPMRPQQVYHGLAKALPDDAIIVLDGSISLSAGQRVLMIDREWSLLDPGRNGCMGSGIPFALGAKLARPARPVITVCGDFAFGFGAMEMETAVRHKIPIVVVIVNNDGIVGSTRQRRFFSPDYPELFSQFLPALRYERLMELFGGHGEWVENAADVPAAIRRAIQLNRPACINVRVETNVPPLGLW